MLVSFDDLSKHQKFFLFASGYFSAMVLADEEELATKTLKTLEACTHLMSEEEWKVLGQYMSDRIGDYVATEEELEESLDDPAGEQE